MLAFICSQTEMKDHPASLRDVWLSTLCPPVVSILLDQGYRYKSVATQIPHNAELVQSVMGDRTDDRRVRSSDSASAP